MSVELEENMNVLVTGSNGQLAREIKKLVRDDESFIFVDKEVLDIANFGDVKRFIDSHDIKVVVNCAAYTAVDKAEDERELAELINYKAVENIAKVSAKRDIFLIHISTDYVFDGKNYKPYIEDDKTNPVNFYGYTKLKSEEVIKKYAKNATIIRTSWVYSEFGNNFVKTMLRLGKERDSLSVVYDQIGTPTYARDLAKVILQIIQHSTLVRAKRQPRTKEDKTQNSVIVFHYSNEGVCSWYDFAREIMRMAKLSCEVYPIQSSEYPTKAKRPYYSVLNKSKIKKELGVEIPYRKESLDKCLQALGERR